ncbi:hypothetical protein [Leucobacter komagatae]|nr:hypothetical protein [Leucobacter komagatae]
MAKQQRRSIVAEPGRPETAAETVARKAERSTKKPNASTSRLPAVDVP